MKNAITGSLVNLTKITLVLVLFNLVKFDNEVLCADRKIDLDYYANLNLTEELEKQYREQNEDKPEEFYMNAEKIGDNDTLEEELDELEDKLDYLDETGRKENRRRKREKRGKNKEKSDNSNWEEKINAFSPHDLLTVGLPRGEYDTFYEDVQNVPTKLTVAFYVHEENAKLDFEIISPNNKQIFRIKGKNRGFHEFNVSNKGVYEFHLDNGRFKTFKKVTFAIHKGSNIEPKLTLEHLQPLLTKLSVTESKMKEAHFAHKILNQKQVAHQELVQKQNNNITTYSLLEIFIMMIIFVVQFFYIRKLVDKV